ncbi:MAG: hypothetical protein QOH24_623 [Verrucomicrobiota bacterium]|jgi:hypothetical protein
MRYGVAKFFSVERIQQAITHLQNFDSNWVLVPLALAAYGVNETADVDVKPGDRFFDRFFSGTLIGLPPFENGVNSLRPRFSDFYQNMVAQGKGTDYVYHQATKLWANVYSSRGYREMRTAGFLVGDRSFFRLSAEFEEEFAKRLSDDFRFEELLVWLYAFVGFPATVSGWKPLFDLFIKTEVEGARLSQAFATRLRVDANYPWPDTFLTNKPTNKQFQNALIPSEAETTHLAVLDGEAWVKDADESDRVEGLDDSSGEPISHYPIDDVLIRTETRTIFEVVRRIKEGRFILDPDFQREFIWPREKQSKLIESAMMRIPLPVFYLAERKDGKVVVVDGLQRLTTFQKFLGGDLVLKGLPDISGLNDKSFTDLPPILQSRVEDTNLVLYLIDHKAPDRAKLDIFERVNSGVPLSRQQFRNCIYVGPATRFLKRQSRTPVFLRATNRGLSWKTMRDRESINRFCAFSLLTVEAYRGEIDGFLGRALETMNKMTPTQLGELENAFQNSMEANASIFGRLAFRKRAGAPVNIALFDVFSVLFSRTNSAHLDEAQKRDFRARFERLLLDPEFLDAISLGTNSIKKVRKRFALAEIAYSNVFAS